MKKITAITLSALMTCGVAYAQHKANLTLAGGAVDTYNTADIDAIDLEGETVTVNLTGSAPVVYNGTVSSISFIKSISGHVTLTEASGWFNAAYVKWENMSGATNYKVYYKPVGSSSYTAIDSELVRNYGATGRADIPGIKAGTYTLKVVPVVGGVENEALASETPVLTVIDHDRSGFAHFNYSQGVGAYQNDGTLKDGAKVFYVTPNTAATITTDVIVDSKGKVQSCTGLQTILDTYQKGYDSTPICFRIIGRVTRDDLDHYSSSAEGLQVKGKSNEKAMNVTIEGIGDDATFHGFGILMRNALSVEISNIGLLWYMDDGVSCDTDNKHCWVHNCDFFYGQKGSDSDQAKGDGSLDVKGDSQYMTFSYNHFWDSGKSSLCGMTSESGPNYLTYHHNWFDHSDSRHPRIRTMSVHVYNNYFDGNAKYGIGSTKGSDVFVEANYFRDCKYPMLTSRQGSDVATDSKGTFSGEDGGSIKSFGNILCGKYYYRPYSSSNTVEFDAWEAPTRDAQVPSTITAKQGGGTYSNWDTDPSLMYTYTAHAAAEVPGVVTGIYGAGRCNHGDLHWTFNNNMQDLNYEVITELSNTIRDYDSWLVGWYEGDTTIGNGGKGFTNPGGDASAGDEFPFGNYNAASGSNPDPGDEDIDPSDYFITDGDGGFFTFGAGSESQVAEWEADGTFTGGSHVPTFTNDTYFPGGTGSYQIAKSGGTLIIKCPSIKVFKAQLVRTGSFAGNIYTSTDGTTFTKVAELSGSKGLMEVDWSAVVKSDATVYVKIENTSSGGLNLVGLCIVK